MANRWCVLFGVLAMAWLSTLASGQCPGAGDCLQANGTPGCDNAACCTNVCANDAFCCEASWDAKCVALAKQVCVIGHDSCPGVGSCFLAQATPGCEDPGCCNAVCFADAYCCKVQWDPVCADEAGTLCGGSGGCPGGGDCSQPNASPGCADADCCQMVCEVDAFCCRSQWDEICVMEAETICSGDDCCSAHAGPGCGDPLCQAAVCNVDDFCCNSVWDELCAAAAVELCSSCGGGGVCGEGDCFRIHETPGCAAIACCQLVCELDAFCCKVQWDPICVEAANRRCDPTGCPGSGDCMQPHVGTGCDDAVCCGLVCTVDSFCCNSQWDELCATAAEQMCQSCAVDLNGDLRINLVDLITVILLWNMPDPAGDVDGDGLVGVQDLVAVLLGWGSCPGAGCGLATSGDCLRANESPFCNDADCCVAVCEADRFCCETAWDALCVELASKLCENNGGDCPGDGECFQPNGSPGCNDVSCCETVCNADPFCCQNNWDKLCATTALELCGTGACPGAGACLRPNGTPGCDDAECCNTVCGVDPFCCETEWDKICVGLASKNCGGSEACPGSGDCATANGTPGCSNVTCCQAVCQLDAFCCETEWDAQCVAEAGKLCDLGPSGCPGQGNCFVNNGTPGCDDLACCQTICAADAFCCENQWDTQCANAASFKCSSGNGACPGTGDCFDDNGTPGCVDPICCNLICGVSPDCCAIAWDASCAIAAQSTCTIEPDCPGAGGSCFKDNGTPGCDDLACCTEICLADAYCCLVAWDPPCVEQAVAGCR